MKLALLRHAKSSWKDLSLADHERPLKKRGTEDALLMGSELIKADLVPEHIFSSTSERTRETVSFLLNQWGMDDTMVSYAPELYLSGAETLLAFVKSLKEFEHVMLVGHNPGLHNFMEKLSNSEIDNFQTAAYSLIEFDVTSWSEIDYGMGHLLEYFYPKMFRDH